MHKCHCFFLRLKSCETVVHTYRSGHTLSKQIGPFNVFASQLTFPCTLIYMVSFPIRTAISYDNHESTSPTRRSKLCTHSIKNFNSEYVVMRSGFLPFFFFFQMPVKMLKGVIQMFSSCKNRHALSLSINLEVKKACLG